MKTGKHIQWLQLKFVRPLNDYELGYVHKIINRFNLIPKVSELEEEWDQFKTILTFKVEEILLKREKRIKNKWPTEEILNNIDKRRKSKGKDQREWQI